MMSLWLVSIHDRRGSIQQTDTAEMKNVNTKSKTESDIFKDWLSTLGELRNPEEMNMHFGRFFSACIKFKQNYELIHWNVSKLPSVHILVNANLDIHTIVSTIENYENRTVTSISVNSNSVQQNVINLVPIMFNSRIALFPYSNIQGNVTINFCGTKWKELDLWFILKNDV